MGCFCPQKEYTDTDSQNERKQSQQNTQAKINSVNRLTQESQTNFKYSSDLNNKRQFEMGSQSVCQNDGSTSFCQNQTNEIHCQNKNTQNQEQTSQNKQITTQKQQENNNMPLQIVINNKNINIKDNLKNQDCKNNGCDNLFTYQEQNSNLINTQSIKDKQNKQVNASDQTFCTSTSEMEDSLRSRTVTIQNPLCSKCQIQIDQMQIQLNCQHFYHQKCLEEYFHSIIFLKEDIVLFCLSCKLKQPCQSALQLLFEQNDIKYTLFTEQLKNNQLLYILQQNKEIIKCKNQNCYFIFKKDKYFNENESFCPICLQNQ